ncbi:MAG: hypothetical protein IBJ18_07945 [Phycisphaerales bacterium]|nr:hypothetical protein [Phycisphaerales bacterium]
MKPTALTDIPEHIRLINQERYKSEIAQAIFSLMEDQGLNRTQLSRLLGVSKGRVSHILGAGDHNFEAETVADIFLALGRQIHVTLGAANGRVRSATDEVFSTIDTSIDTESETQQSTDISNGKTQQWEVEQFKGSIWPGSHTFTAGRATGWKSIRFETRLTNRIFQQHAGLNKAGRPTDVDFTISTTPRGT